MSRSRSARGGRRRRGRAGRRGRRRAACRRARARRPLRSRRRVRRAPRRRPGRRAARPARRGSRSVAKTSSPRRVSTAPNSRPTKPLPTTSTRPPRQPLRGAQHAGERLDVGARSRRRPRRAGRASAVACARSANPPGTIVAARNASQVDSCPARQRVAFAAGQVVDERDAPPVELRDDLVAEHRPRGRGADLLDVGAAQPAGEHADERAVPSGSGTSASRRLPRLVENDRAHRGIVGPWQ